MSLFGHIQHEWGMVSLQAFLTHIGARMAELGPKAFLYHGVAICAVAAA